MLPFWTSAGTDTNPAVQFQNTANAEPQHLPLRNALMDTHFYLVPVILIPKYSCFWEISSPALKSLKNCVEAEILPAVTHL